MIYYIILFIIKSLSNLIMNTLRLHYTVLFLEINRRLLWGSHEVYKYALWIFGECLVGTTVDTALLRIYILSTKNIDLFGN